MTKRILIVLSNREISVSLYNFLKEMGYTVKVCDTANNAMEMIRNFDPNMILSGEQFHDLSGIDLAGFLKSQEKTARIPFLLLSTANPAESDILPPGIDDIIRLPFNQTTLYGKVTKWLEAEEPPAPKKPVIEQVRLKKPKPKKSEQPWASGRVWCLSLGRLFYNLLDSEQTGLLTLKNERGNMEIEIHTARVVNVTSNYLRNETFGHYLLQQRKITPSERRASFARSQELNLPQGRTLCVMGVLDETECERMVEKHKRAKLMKIFDGTWDGAAFKFQSKKIQKSKSSMKPVPLQLILRKGILEIASTTQLMRAIDRRKKADVRMYIEGDFNRLAEKLELDEDIIEKAVRLHAKTVIELRQLPPKRFSSLLRLAFLLLVTKGARFGELPQAQPERSAFEKTYPAAGEPTAQEESTPEPVVGSVREQASHLATQAGRKELERGKFDQAKATLKEALEQNPKNSEALGMLAWCIFQSDGRTNRTVAEECKKMLQAAIALRASNEMAYFYLGKIYRHENKNELADTYFRKAHDLEPSNEIILREVKLLEIRQRKYRVEEFR